MLAERVAWRVAWRGTAVGATALALLVSTSLKVWSLGNVGAVATGAAGVVAAGALLCPTPVS